MSKEDPNYIAALEKAIEKKEKAGLSSASAQTPGEAGLLSV